MFVIGVFKFPITQNLLWGSSQNPTTPDCTVMIFHFKRIMPKTILLQSFEDIRPTFSSYLLKRRYQAILLESFRAGLNQHPVEDPSRMNTYKKESLFSRFPFHNVLHPIDKAFGFFCITYKTDNKANNCSNTNQYYTPKCKAPEAIYSR